MGLRDRLTIVLFILLMLSKGAVWAADEFKIIRISPEGGFAFDAINAISEDKFGFIWFGTNSGVYRYNTVETAKFINLPDDKSSIPGNNIRSIYRDQKGDIWISTNNGLCQFDYQCECFNRMALHDLAGNQRGTSVYQVLQSSDGHFWMIDNSGFGSFDPIAGVANNLPMPDSRKNETIRVAAIDQEGKRIWLGGLNGGIYSCDPPYREIKFHAATRDVSVIALLPDGDKLWVGYDWGGTDLFSASGTLMEHYSDDVQGKNRIPSSRVRAIFRNKDEIWIGSFKGLVRLKGDQINVIEKEKYPGLLNNSIFQFFRDSKNGIWIGTWSGGLSYINEWTNSFEHYKREPYGNSLSDNVVSDFEETPDRKIIIATEEGHLNFLDPVTRKIDVAYINSPSGLVNHIKSLHTDPNGTLWVGTFASGIFYRSRGSESFRHFDLISNSKEQFYDITSDKDGVWFASSLRGLYHYSFHTQTVTQYMPVNSDPESISSTMVRSLLFDSSGNLWVGTNGGLNLMRKNTEKFVRYFYNPERKNRISSNVIYSLLEDSKKNIWIGTAGGGVNIFDPATATFSQLSKAEGLAGNDVYGIQEDDTGTIWMSTENGISAYSPATREFRNFDFTDGLQSNQFNPGSVFKSSNGELYFGGSNGFNRFDPKKMKMNPIAPKAYITGLEINNLDVSHVTDPDLIPQSLLTVDKLVLKHNQNSLRFEFVANNFLLPQKNCFRYRLIGYSQDWIEAKKENKAVFTKIPPGNYVFEVMASNNDGLWNTEPTRLEVVILSPFWLTWYAFVFYLLVGGTLFFIVARELRLRNQLQHSVMQERISRENEERLHQLKLHFFTNISHEFRTPLTLILSPLAILKRKSNQHADTTEQIALIEHNANRLLRLVNQILDLRKIELGKADFNPQPIDIVALSEEVFQCFSTLENDRKIRFRFESDFTTLPINIDPDKIDKLIYNLLSNAMKFTHPEGTISLQVREPGWMEPKRPEPYRFAEGEAVSGDHITVVVSNDGAGIDPVDLPNIFSRFYQAHGQIAGTGIGLHLCSEYIRLHHGQIEVFTGENMGATFLVHLPVTADEIGKGISGEVRKETRCCDQPEEAEPISVTNDDKKGRGARILVVDDNREMRNFLKEILSEHYQVLTANDGAEGLEIVREHAPDLIVSDVMMPGMDGNELCHAIKSDLNTSHLPVLLLTALSTVEHQMEGFRLGADDYVVKPFDDRLLLSRIKNLLESRERLREKFLGSPGEWKEEMQKLQPDNELIERATRAIGQYLVDPNFSTDLLASELNLSRSSLHRKLRALTNQSATEFVKFVRINKSIELIENGESNIDEICFKVGFNSHSYYSMCFKKQMGVTPSEYINRMRRENGGKKGE